MKNLGAHEKSKGVLLFAFNSRIDYVTIAKRCARLIGKNMNLPITLVTDSDLTLDTDVGMFDHIINVENHGTNHKLSEAGLWRNTDRYSAYELSPYDETLLLDTDYLVLDDSLLKYFELVDYDYRLMHRNHTLDQDWNDKMGLYGIPYVWATIVLFRKCEKAKMLFDLVGRIQRNWEYYSSLYNMRTGNFRNDYAFAIANSIVSGYTLDQDQSFFGEMLTLDKKIISLELRVSANVAGIADIVAREDNRATILPLMNLHVMDKDYLQSDQFNTFVEEVVCAG